MDDDSQRVIPEELLYKILADIREANSEQLMNAKNVYRQSKV